ncbi:MAG: quorum sensing histidine kinase QseC [Rubrivivax sp.]
MSLQRRLLLFLLIGAPVVWALAVLASVDRARHEIDELFDTEIIRLARQVQSTLTGLQVPGAPLPPLDTPAGARGEADLRDLAIAVWDAQGRRLLVDREGAQLPHRTEAVGFVELPVGGDLWRVYYLQSPHVEWLVAAGQRVHEREELVWNLLGSQLAPWLLVLPVLLAAMAWAVRRAMAPVRALTAELQARGADALRPVPVDHAPQELQPMLVAMNGLFRRIEATLARERRFTADAAHELRTPLAVLRAQWDALRAAPDDTARREAELRLGRGLDRLDRLVTQMLALSRLEATDRLPAPAPIDWAPLVEQAISDVLPLADRRRVELALEGDPAAFALQGDAGLLAVLLRNLLDNAVRYAPGGSTVLLRFAPGALEVDNGGPALSPEALARLGERFHRDDGQAEGGSGLGLSIAQRVAVLHGLRLSHAARADGTGVVARLSST